MTPTWLSHLANVNADLSKGLLSVARSIHHVSILSMLVLACIQMRKVSSQLSGGQSCAFVRVGVHTVRLFSKATMLWSCLVLSEELLSWQI